jgi:hypothetical protein
MALAAAPLGSGCFAMRLVSESRPINMRETITLNTRNLKPELLGSDRGPWARCLVAPLSFTVSTPRAGGYNGEAPPTTPPRLWVAYGVAHEADTGARKPEGTLHSQLFPPGEKSDKLCQAVAAGERKDSTRVLELTPTQQGPAQAPPPAPAAPAPAAGQAPETSPAVQLDGKGEWFQGQLVLLAKHADDLEAGDLLIIDLIPVTAAEVVDPSGTQSHLKAAGRFPDGRLRDPGGTPVDETLSAFRLRTVWNHNWIGFPVGAGLIVGFLILTAGL